MLGKRITVVVDRPMGSCHPRYPTLCYPINYGYVTDLMAGDGEEQDVYILGVDRPIETFTGIVIGIIRRRNDVEDKWVAAPEGYSFTREEIWDAVKFQEQYFESELTVFD